MLYVNRCFCWACEWFIPEHCNCLFLNSTLVAFGRSVSIAHWKQLSDVKALISNRTCYTINVVKLWKKHMESKRFICGLSYQKGNVIFLCLKFAALLIKCIISAMFLFLNMQQILLKLKHRHIQIASLWPKCSNSFWI